jgi:hypothetical protein
MLRVQVSVKECSYQFPVMEYNFVVNLCQFGVKSFQFVSGVSVGLRVATTDTVRKTQD